MKNKKIILTEEQFRNLLQFKNRGYTPKTNYCSKTNLFKNKYINEAIFKTYPIDFVIRHFCQYLNFANDYQKFATNPKNYCGFITEVVSENGLSYIEMVIEDNAEVLNKTDKTLNLCGYYKSFCEDYCEGYLQCGYEKRHENKIKDLGVDKIYHITIRENKLKIKRDGLEPKSKNKNTFHLNRVYFFTKDFGKNGFLTLAKQLYKDKTTFGYIVYEIDVNSLKNVNFYFDVNTEYGIYTTDNISPDVLKIKYEYKES